MPGCYIEQLIIREVGDDFVNCGSDSNVIDNQPRQRSFVGYTPLKIFWRVALSSYFENPTPLKIFWRVYPTKDLLEGTFFKMTKKANKYILFRMLGAKKEGSLRRPKLAVPLLPLYFSRALFAPQ